VFLPDSTSGMANLRVTDSSSVYLRRADTKQSTGAGSGEVPIRVNGSLQLAGQTDSDPIAKEMTG
jgi:hypothetical protein